MSSRSAISSLRPEMGGKKAKKMGGGPKNGNNGQKPSLLVYPNFWASFPTFRRGQNPCLGLSLHSGQVAPNSPATMSLSLLLIVMLSVCAPTKTRIFFFEDDLRVHPLACLPTPLPVWQSRLRLNSQSLTSILHKGNEGTK